MNDLSVAISLAARKFEGKFDKGGMPYIMHCLAVMNKVRHLGTRAMIVGVLHDIIEDTDITEEDLALYGFDEEIIANIVALTKTGDVDNQTYIENISVMSLARPVKMADLEHNSDITRLKGIRQKDIDRMVKYHHSYIYLKEAHALHD